MRHGSLATVTVDDLDPAWFVNANTPADVEGAGVGHTGAMSDAPVPEIDVTGWRVSRRSGAYVLDVRQDEYEAGHVPGAALIPLDELATRHAESCRPTSAARHLPVRRPERGRAGAARRRLRRHEHRRAGRSRGSTPASPRDRGPDTRVSEDHAPPPPHRRCRRLRRRSSTPAGAAGSTVDTEFHRERTYFPTVALVQIKWGDEIVLVDPLAVDLGPLAPVLDGPGLAVMHAATQDLEVLQRACGTVPSRLFDTQLAAGFLGFTTPSLASLAERILGVDLPKASRLTDWLRRPLGEDQQRYAAADVDHLIELTRLSPAELDSVGRLAWAEEECEELRTRGWGPPDPEEAWLRLKEGRSLKGRARAVAQELAAWRERRAAEVDQPVRHVLSDLAIVGIATNPPKTLEQLRRIRGIDERNARGRLGEELLAAVERGRSAPEDDDPRTTDDEVDRDQRPAVALVSAWLSQLGRDLRIDPMLLATRSDLGPSSPVIRTPAWPTAGAATCSASPSAASWPASSPSPSTATAASSSRCGRGSR